MPSWPPMDPISKSLFVCWSTYNLPIGARRESVGTVTIAVFKECGTDRKLVALLQRLQESRIGIYRVESGWRTHSMTDAADRMTELAHEATYVPDRSRFETRRGGSEEFCGDRKLEDNRSTARPCAVTGTPANAQALGLATLIRA